MARTELTVDVEARLTVSEETAQRCLLLLEMWQNDHRDKKIVRIQTSDGTFVFVIVDNDEPKEEENAE